MLARLEPVTTVASTFRWAATYALALTEDALYVIKLGPAMAPETYSGVPYLYLATHRSAEEIAGAALGVAAAQPVLQKISEKYGAEVEAGMARLAEQGPEAMAGEKGSFRLGKGDIEGLKPGRSGNVETLELKTSARPFRFHVRAEGAADFHAFMDTVRAWADS